MLFKSICRVCAGFKCVECLYARVLQRRSCPLHCDHMVSLHHSRVIFHPSITSPNSAAADIPLTTCLGGFSSPLPVSSSPFSSLSSVAPPRSSSIHLSLTREHRLEGHMPEFERVEVRSGNQKFWNVTCLRGDSKQNNETHPHWGEGGGGKRRILTT